MSDSLIPRITEPISAYDLLTKVCEVITEEPKRYNQAWWLYRLNTKLYRLSADDFPACGTMCCVAGWVEVMRVGPSLEMDPWGGDIEDTARLALGLTRLQAERLFNAHALNAYVHDDEQMPSRGTPEYAALGVKHIQAFQRRYQKRLKAKIVEPVR